jgi:hypothetical protein
VSRLAVGVLDLGYGVCGLKVVGWGCGVCGLGFVV